MVEKKTILLVDDEEILLWSLSQELSKNYNVITAINGLLAVEALQQNPEIELLITDIYMPEMDGLELIEAVKYINPSVKVIVMTAFSSPDIQKSTTQKGCLSYLEKPFVVSKLQSIIEDLLSDGFGGTVMSLQLPDVIQLISMGRKSVRLQIKHNNEEGFIYFERGQIIHATQRELEGEKAFFQLFFWDSGHFDMLPYQVPKHRTIHNDVDFLLLEAIRLKDEVNVKKQNEETDSSQLATHSLQVLRKENQAPEKKSVKQKQAPPTEQDSTEEKALAGLKEDILEQSEKFEHEEIPFQLKKALRVLLEISDVENIILLDKKSKTIAGFAQGIKDDVLNMHWIFGASCDRMGQLIGNTGLCYIHLSGQTLRNENINMLILSTPGYYLGVLLKEEIVGDNLAHIIHLSELSLK